VISYLEAVACGRGGGGVVGEDADCYDEIGKLGYVGRRGVHARVHCDCHNVRVFRVHVGAPVAGEEAIRGFGWSRCHGMGWAKFGK
jgi:hypothetical protein